MSKDLTSTIVEKILKKLGVKSEEYLTPSERVIVDAVKTALPAHSKIIYCCECRFYTVMRPDLDTGICSLACRHLGAYGFCSEAERRTDGETT